MWRDPGNAAARWDSATIVTTWLGAVVGTFLYMPPRFVPTISDVTEGLRLVIFLAAGMIIAAVFDRLRQAEQQERSSREV